MAQEQTTIGDVSARLIKLMATLGGNNDLMFARGTIEQLQCRAYAQLPGAFDELLGTLEMLAQDARHDREAARRERDNCVEQAERLFAHANRLTAENSRLSAVCQQQGRLIDELNEPGV